MKATEYRGDGNFYCEETCSRCRGIFYVHALQNVPLWYTRDTALCPWCEGKCTAAELSFRNAAIEEAAWR